LNERARIYFVFDEMILVIIIFIDKLICHGFTQMFFVWQSGSSFIQKKSILMD